MTFPDEVLGKSTEVLMALGSRSDFNLERKLSRFIINIGI